MEFIFSEGSEASGRRVDGLAFVNKDVVGESAELGSLACWDPGGPGKAFVGCFYLGCDLSPRASEWSPLWNKKCLERGPPDTVLHSPHSLQGEWPGHHLPVELEPDVGGPRQSAHGGRGGPGLAPVVTHQAGLLVTQHLSW